eukprot:gi/632957844/ref/XP_007894706.1/ PREDICTED: inositol polyphosphate 5-phosphatase K [Callorhinchus milii]
MEPHQSTEDSGQKCGARTGERFRLQIVTWNVGTASPPDNVTLLLGLESTETETDMFVIGLQEVNSSVTAFLVDLAFNDAWSVFLMDALAPRGYVKVTSIRMQGILLLIFVKSRHLPFIRDLQTNYTRTGIYGYWVSGHKGGVTIRLSIYGHLACFLNCHLPAHMDNVDHRLDSFQRILDAQQFSGEQAGGILEHELLFWLGDLNFRIADHGMHFVRETIRGNRFHLLWDKDQLNMAKKTETILQGFQEGALRFKPTYKFDLGSENYDTSGKKRKPAWTDRILWKVRERPREGAAEADGPRPGEPATVNLESYGSRMEYGISDHKPVAGTFGLEFEKLITEPLVKLQPEGRWTPGRDAIVSYRMSQLYPSSTWDWIGLYRVGFRDRNDYVTYIWVKDDELLHSQDTFQVYLSSDYVPTGTGTFLLCYCSSNLDSLVGVSDHFQICPEPEPELECEAVGIVVGEQCDKEPC